MKKIINNLLILFCSAIFIAGCDSEELTVLNNDASTTFSLSANEFVLVKENIGQDVLTATWTKPDFGYTAGPNYMVVFSTTEKSKAVSAGSNLSKVFETEELNKILISLDVLPNISTEINVQLKVVLSEYSEILSNIATITVTPYSTWIGPEYLFLVGSGIDPAANWDNTNHTYSFFRDPVQSGLYVYTGKFRAGEVKALETPGAWQPQWGKGSADGVLAGNPGTQTGDPNAIAIPADGYYTLKLDFAKNTYSLTAFDATNSTIYPTLGVIGAATPTGWGSQTAMTQSAFDPHFWTLTSLQMNQSDGGDCDCGFKFRVDDSWNPAWGGKENPPSLNYGIASTSGKNIGVPETGNYIIHFNTLDFRYSYELIK